MNKQTRTILIIAAVLLALLLIFENPFKGERPSRWREEEEKVQLFTPISEEECSRIELSGFGTTATLVQKDHRWFTQDGYKADPEAIPPLFLTLADFGEPELISINPDAFLKFRVDPLLGTRMKMTDTAGAVRVDLIIGELQTDFFHTPVRRPDSNKVFRVKGMFRGILQRPTWRDQNIFRLNAQELRRVKIQRPDESYAIVQETTTDLWHFCEPTSEPVDSQQVQGWLERIARLRATDLQPTTGTDMLTTFGLTSPTARLSVELNNGSSYTLVFGNQNLTTKQYYAKRLDDPQVYRIDSRTYSDLLRKSAELKPKPEIAPPAELPTSPTIVRPTTGTAQLGPPARPSKTPQTPAAAAKVKTPKPSTSPTSPSASVKKAPPKSAPKAGPAPSPRPRRVEKPTSGTTAR